MHSLLKKGKLIGASDSLALSVLMTSLDAIACTLCLSHPSVDLLTVTPGAAGSPVGHLHCDMSPSALVLSGIPVIK